MKVKTKLTIIIIPLVFTFVFVNYFLIDSFSMNIQDEIITSFNAEGKNILDKVSRNLFERQKDIIILTLDKNDFLSDHSRPMKEKIEYLRTLVASSKFYDSISLYDPNGIKIGDTRYLSIGNDQSTKPFFVEAMKGKIYVDQIPVFPDYDESSKIGFDSPIIHISGPLYDDDENIVGLVVAKFSMDKIHHIVDSSISNQKTNVDLWSKDGTLIFSNHNRGELLIQKLNSEILLDNLQEGHETNNAYFIEENGIKKITVETHGSGFFDYDNDWIVTLSMPENSAFIHRDDLRNKAVIISMIIIIPIILVIIFVFSTISKPLEKLEKAMLQVQKGDLDIQTNIHSNDEIGELAKTFDYMVQSLKKTLQLEHDLKETKKSLKEQRFTIIGEISSRLAHDLRNPLSIIKVSLENLKLQFGTDESKQKQFNKVERSIDRITHQIDDVLGFVRGIPLSFQKYKISEIITESLDSIKIPRYIQLNLPKNDAEVDCDKRQLVIALNNIILNAVQAIEGKGSIIVGLEESSDSITLTIEDSGTGIAESDLPNIFDALFTTKMQGTGLGLASVKSIIESHGGIISVTSPPTIFTITLPKNQ